ncbi:MAG: hypothetical protein OXG04_15095 [Acidobacteria bacterium]|nr:hypothetical protein [Acidobacteriota bacterium]
MDGRTAAEAYLDRHGRRCTPDERAWMNAQQAAWLSVWEVLAVDPGRTVTLRDLLSDEQRTVQEKRGSRSLVPRDAVLARIVDHEGISLLCGMHPRALPPFGAAEVVRSARGRLLRRRGAVPIDRLRDPAFGSYLIRHWEEAVNAGDAESAGPPQFRNVRVEPTALALETNSVARADALRTRIERACGTRIRHRAREHTDPQALLKDRKEPPAPPVPRLARGRRSRGIQETPLRSLARPAATRPARADTPRCGAHRSRTGQTRTAAEADGAHGEPLPGRPVRFLRAPPRVAGGPHLSASQILRSASNRLAATARTLAASR